MEKEDSFEVPNDDILGGIKSAVERGETLKEAMVSLFNAGYSKEEIEDAARKYMMGKTEESLYGAVKKEKSGASGEEKKVEEKKDKLASGQSPEVKKEPKSGGSDLKKKLNSPLQKKAPQKVSKYEGTKKKKGFEPITIVLILLLVLLAGILISVFLF
ncbi:hypothetical protein B6U91_01115, partial [Candidatus Pacearchaeota archaeon ex4484_71]